MSPLFMTTARARARVPAVCGVFAGVADLQERSGSGRDGAEG
jgi:hypothetical protein